MMLFILNCLRLLLLTAMFNGEDEGSVIVGPGQAIAFSGVEQGSVSEAALGGGPLQPLTELRAPAAGEHWLAYLSRDQAGNTSELRWIRVLVDSLAPDVTLSFDPEPVTNEKGILWLPPGGTVRAEARDDIAGIKDTTLLINNNGDRVAGSSAVGRIPQQGSVHITANSSDKVGNQTPPVTRGLVIDHQPPSGEITIAGPHVREGDRVIGGGDISLTAAITDSESGLVSWQAYLDGQAVEKEVWTGSWTQGVFRASAIASDRVGNKGEIGPLEFEIDTIPPRISWQILSEAFEDSDKNLWMRPPVRLRVESVDEAAGVAEMAWSITGSQWQPVVGDLQIDGSSVHLRASDRVGNTATQRASWNYDGQPPSILLFAPDGAPVTEPELTIRFGEEIIIKMKDDGSGIGQKRYHLDDGTWRPIPVNERFLFKKRGSFKLVVEVTDRLDNRTAREWVVKVKKAERN